MENSPSYRVIRSKEYRSATLFPTGNQIVFINLPANLQEQGQTNRPTSKVEPMLALEKKHSAHHCK